MAVIVDISKVMALGDYVRYSEESMFVGSAKHTYPSLITSWWLREVLGTEFGFQTYDRAPVHGLPTPTVFEVFGSDWSVLFQTGRATWWDGDDPDIRIQFQTYSHYTPTASPRRHNNTLSTDLVFVGDHAAYQRDMTLFLLLASCAQRSVIRKARVCKNIDNNVYDMFILEK